MKIWYYSMQELLYKAKTSTPQKASRNDPSSTDNEHIYTKT